MHIEYKRDQYGKSDADKKEALKDITSFANSAGGHLIIGIEESEGVAQRLEGLGSDVNVDALINRMESLARDGVEPRIAGIRIRRIDLVNNATAIVIRVPKSWNPPHRVSTGNSNRFYVRNSAGVHEASVEELRVLFTLAANAQQRIEEFRSERLAKIRRGYAPVNFAENGRLVVHLVPLSAYGSLARIDLQNAHGLQEKFCPMGTSYGLPSYNLEGVLISRNIGSDGNCYGYTQVFRDGSIEATKAGLIKISNGAQTINIGTIANDIFVKIQSYFESLRALEVPTPIVVMVSTLGTGNAKLSMGFNVHEDDDFNPFPPDDPLLLPPVIVENFEAPVINTLKPIFDVLWNISGLSKCNYYNSSGNWVPPS